MVLRPAGCPGAGYIIIRCQHRMLNHLAVSRPAKAATDMVVISRPPPLKPCLINTRNLQAGPALAKIPHRNSLAKTQAPSPQARQKNPAHAKPAGISLANQQNRTAAMLQLNSRIMCQMQKNAPKNRDKDAKNHQIQELTNRDLPNRAHLNRVPHSRDRADMAG